MPTPSKEEIAAAFKVAKNYDELSNNWDSALRSDDILFISQCHNKACQALKTLEAVLSHGATAEFFPARDYDALDPIRNEVKGFEACLRETLKIKRRALQP